MFSLTRLHQVKWPLRLLIALVGGVAVDQLLGQALTALYWSMGIWNQEVLLGPYALLPLIFRSSCAAFTAALIFGRLELLVAILQFAVLVALSLLIIRALSGWEAMQPAFKAAIDEGLAAWSDPLETGIVLLAQALMWSGIGAYLAFIIRKYREARVYGQRARSLPGRWNFRLGGGLIFTLGAGLMAFSVYRLVIGPFSDNHFNPITAGISGAVLYFAAMMFARISAFGRRLMGVRAFVPEASFDFLLFRSFEDDRIPCRPAYPFFILNPIVHDLDGRTLSDAIVSELGRHGRVLALGNPSEIVGSSDAERPYFPTTTEDWKAYVRDALRSAKMIVVVPGTSEGLAWEMSAIRDLGALDRTLFVLPAEAEKKPAKRTREQRVTALASATGLALSETDFAGDEMAVVQVTPDGTPRIAVPEINQFRRLRDVRAFLTSAFDEKITEAATAQRSHTSTPSAATA